MAAPSSTTLDLWTSACVSRHDNNSKARVELEHYFESGTFRPSEAAEIPFYLQTRLEAAQEKNAPFVIFVRFGEEASWVQSVLSRVFPSLPVDFLQSTTTPHKRARGTIMLPRIHRKAQSMSFFMQYPQVLGKQSKPGGLHDLDGNTVNFAPIGTWLSMSPDSPTPSSPVLLVVVQDLRIMRKMRTHCVSGNWDLARLGRSPGRIFIDLFVFLADWSEIWIWARRLLAFRDATIHGDGRFLKPPVLKLTRELHRFAASIIALKEDLGLHIAAFRRLQSVTARNARPSSKLRLIADDEREEWEDEIEECMQNLLHHQESSAVIQRQVENLISLTLNMEMVSQSHSILTITVLATFLLPPSFAATLFGMNAWTASLSLYPVFALTCLTAVGTAIIIARNLPDFLYRHRKQRRIRNADKSAHEPTSRRWWGRSDRWKVYMPLPQSALSVSDELGLGRGEGCEMLEGPFGRRGLGGIGEEDEEGLL